MNIYAGIDNGVGGSIGVLDELGSVLYAMNAPVTHEQNYTKSKGNIGRIDHRKLYCFFRDLREECNEKRNELRIFMERPMTALNRYHAVVSGMRALESTLIIMERLHLRFEYVDSKEWQSVMLPKGAKKEQLKVESMTLGCRLFPKCRKMIRKHKDADGLLIAEAMRRLKR